MKVVVCVKQVNEEINPFDACALECALSIENAEVTVISMGKPKVSEMLKALTRLGVDRAILLTDNAFAGADTLATSYTLALTVRKLEPDLIICGRQSVDGDTAQVGPCLSQMLGFSLITNVMKIHKIDKEIFCTSRLGEENVKLPALLTVERINTLRFPSIRAKVKEVEIWTAVDLNADIDRCGLRGSPTKVLKTYESSIGKRKCRYIQPNELMSIINESKNKAINYTDIKPSESKLSNVLIIGEELERIALSIAENVGIIGKQPIRNIIDIIRSQNPKVVLWPSDLWGRRNAPIAAAELNAGLCADCTHLETDGEKLYMYRPAYGGSLMAKIVCRTNPQMATVRTVTNSENDIIVSGGKGAKDSIDLLKNFANSIGAKLGASRSLVDTGIVPYEMQIGITGKNVNPRVYIACGISGAVQHTSSIEQAGIIIAINIDKNARIFDYADYGIVGSIESVIGDYMGR